MTDAPPRETDTQATPPGLVSSLLARPLLAGVRLYQVLLSPLMGGHCRFDPSCSRYAATALQTHGAFRGSWLAARRLARCHPFGGSGHDPVPEAPAGEKRVPPSGGTSGGAGA